MDTADKEAAALDAISLEMKLKEERIAELEAENKRLRAEMPYETTKELTERIAALEEKWQTALRFDEGRVRRIEELEAQNEQLRAVLRGLPIWDEIRAALAGRTK